MIHYNLSQKVAIITGGLGGIGQAAALAFANEYAKVIIWDLDAEKGKKAEYDIRINSGGKSIKFMLVDITNLEQVEAATEAVNELYGSIDILINNAGITRDASLQKMTTEQWQQVIDVNLTGVFNCTKFISPYMIKQKFGRIINTSSIVGLQGNYGQSNYVATKAGVVGLTKVWARELGPKGITVNAVAPGFIATGMIATVPQKFLDAAIARTPLGRVGTPKDVANAYLFLASKHAAFINGVTLRVDGGMVI